MLTVMPRQGDLESSKQEQQRIQDLSDSLEVSNSGLEDGRCEDEQRIRELQVRNDPSSEKSSESLTTVEQRDLDSRQSQLKESLQAQRDLKAAKSVLEEKATESAGRVQDLEAELEV